MKKYNNDPEFKKQKLEYMKSYYLKKKNAIKEEEDKVTIEQQE
jgi:hypothetical protein